MDTDSNPSDAESAIEEDVLEPRSAGRRSFYLRPRKRRRISNPPDGFGQAFRMGLVGESRFDKMGVPGRDNQNSSLNNPIPYDIRQMLQSPDGPTVTVGYLMNPGNLERNYASCAPLKCCYPRYHSIPGVPGMDFGPSEFFEIDLQHATQSERTQSTSPTSLQNLSNNSKTLVGTKEIKDSTSKHLLSLEDSHSKATPLNTSKIPTEIFEHIIWYLSRNDLCNLRLVDRAFEHGVSGKMFETIVVPFNTEIYGILSAPDTYPHGTYSHVAPLASLNPMGLSDVSASKDKSTQDHNRGSTGSGLDVFGGFGHHIRRFGISFDVCEESLLNSPTKVAQENHDTFWGSYIWPYSGYKRFRDRAGLEFTADETSTMKLAFSHLKAVRHLALSLDSGLGWLNGSDVSIRGRVLQRARSMFARSDTGITSTLPEQRNFWLKLESIYRAAGCPEDLKQAGIFKIPQSNERMHNAKSELTNANMVVRSRWIHRSDLLLADSIGSDGKFNDDTSRVAEAHRLAGGEWELLSPAEIARLTERYRNRPDNEPSSTRDLRKASSEEETVVTMGESNTREGLMNETSQSGIFCIRPLKKNGETIKPYDNSNYPRNLSRSQKEWLLETAWAQEAFLSSYMIAVADNKSVFQNVQSLELSCISSRHLPKLLREDFWTALPSLNSLDIRVTADRRGVYRAQDGSVYTRSTDPLEAMTNFYRLLKLVSALKESIKALCIGWVGGGEHAEGLFARNKNVLPAPLLPKAALERVEHHDALWHLIVFPTVKKLKLVNCWSTPAMLTSFVSRHKELQLRELILESFSLTANSNDTLRNAAQQGDGDAQQDNGAVQNAPAQQMTSLVPQPLAHLAADMGQAQLANNTGQVGNPIPGAHTTNLGLQQLNWGHILSQQTSLAHVSAQTIPHAQGIGHALPNPSITSATIPHPRVQQGPREGSWPDVLQLIKKAFLSVDNKDIELILRSCGHVTLRGANFDQTILYSAANANDWAEIRLPLEHFFLKRKEMLQECTMRETSVYLGNIAPAVPRNEANLLKNTWGMEDGWPKLEHLDDTYDDEDGFGLWGRKSREAAEYDGQPLGGTGRFSGKIHGFCSSTAENSAR